MIWTTTVKKEGDVLGKAEWYFHNSDWKKTERNSSKDKEVDDTVMDPNSKVVITDFSDSLGLAVREYSLYVNDTYTLRDEVVVKDPWSFEQDIKFVEGDNRNWMAMHVHFDGDKWVSSLNWDGNYDTTLTVIKRDGNGQDYSVNTTSMTSWNHPEDNGMSFAQTVDLQNQHWSSICDWGNGRTWV